MGRDAQDQDLERIKSELRHDLRTPMSAIMGLSQLLLDELDGPLTPEQRHQIQLIYDAAGSLDRIINTRLARAPSA